MPPVALTPASGLTPYCTPAQYCVYCDWRTSAQLVSDTETQPYANPTAFQADPVLAAELSYASGLFEAACLKGNRYLPTDLAALTGNSAALLQRLVAKTAEGAIVRRRPDAAMPMPEEYFAVTGPDGWLDRLSNGEIIFSFTETMEAGQMNFDEVTERDIFVRGLATNQARRYFGRRAQDLQGPNGVYGGGHW